MKRFAIATALVLLGACGGDADDDAGTTSTSAAAAGAELSGILALTQGSCEDQPTGSYFRMVQPGGTVDGGPFVINGDSPCTDKTITPLSPGSDGGLRLGTFQPNPNPAFDQGGNATASGIAEPQAWFAVKFALSTNDADAQTGKATKPPTIRASGGKVTADLRALSAAWNGQHFNQGAPKPDGSMPGATRAATGTFDEATRAITLEWASQIVGGPFNNFTGVWHLQGTIKGPGNPDL